ncbi:MAG: ribonuclease HI family protein [Armatimonadetes bacterium]|jgi:ribonuclease HI|nr:ribonuclease HI family protein [Armatimonadota bacterium]
MKRLVIFSDGASKGNPGDAGIGVVIFDAKGIEVRTIADYIGKTTNNVAEYTALIRGLAEAQKLGATHVDICTDSELLVRQLTGAYKVKSANLKPLFEELMALLRAFQGAQIKHVMRGQNARADELANEGVKKHRQDARNSSIASDAE